jgi:hypothetical protein
VPGTAERGQAAGDHHSLVQRCTGLVKPPGESPDGEPMPPVAVPEGDEHGQLERLTKVKRPTSRAVTSATRRLPRSSARRKTALGCPWLVAALLPWGRTRRTLQLEAGRGRRPAKWPLGQSLV